MNQKKAIFIGNLFYYRYEYTFRGDRLWRKNRSSPEKGGVCIGVDLNRNYGYRWGGLGTSKQPCREIFAGTGPFSEPETNAVKNFFETSASNFKVKLLSKLKFTLRNFREQIGRFMS